MPELSAQRFNKNIIFVSAGILLVSIFTAILTNEILLCLAPLAFLLAYQLLIDFRPVFYLLLLITPLSIEFAISDGFSTDLPTEPLEIILMFTFIFYVILRRENINVAFLNHPVTIILLLHFLWMCIATIYSQNTFVSFKYMLAKTWYISVFYFLASHVIRKPEHFRIAFWCLFIPTLFAVLYTLTNHYRYNFAFSEVNKTMFPYFRNHVNYAVFLALLLPFLFYAQSWYQKYTWHKMIIRLGIGLLLAGVYFSYTRSAWLSLLAAGMCYLLIRKNLLRQFVVLAVTGAVVFVIYMLNDNRYLAYAPDFKKTIYHANFEDHMESTISLEDVSSAERIYRWIAATHMVEDKPVLGFGPAQYYDNYKEYTVNKFLTYISTNDERSTVHNYFLQVTVEQGFVGLFFWVLLLISVLFFSQIAYNSADKKQDKNYILALTLSLITIIVNITLSDLVEADKIGTLFFFNLAMIVNMHLAVKKQQTKDLLAE
ncbi:MAG: O-antigen ligase family protein [Chitinophagales bacterium]